jgi:hypothetical protein
MKMRSNTEKTKLNNLAVTDFIKVWTRRVSFDIIFMG